MKNLWNAPTQTFVRVRVASLAFVLLACLLCLSGYSRAQAPVARFARHRGQGARRCSRNSRWSRKSSSLAASTACLPMRFRRSSFRASRCQTPRSACAPGDRRRPMPAAQPWLPPGIATLRKDLGESLGRDARARGVNFLLGPGVNIARSPVSGRNFEYLSEDPYLNGALVVPYIEGVQSQGVSATVKHYALNNQEYNRHNVDVTADERTMREIYLPAFEAAVTKGHVDAVMDSYNLINGVARHAERFPEPESAQGRVGISRRADVGLGRDLRRRSRSKQRTRSRNAIAALHERADAGGRREERHGEGVDDRRQGAAAVPRGAALRLARSPAIRSRRFNLLRRRSRGCAERRARRASRCSRTTATLCPSMQRRSRPSPSLVRTHGRQSQAAVDRPRRRHLSRSAS